MLRAVGFTDEDFHKPMIGIASTWSEITPCNIHINKLAEKVKEGVREAGEFLKFTEQSQFLMELQWVTKECTILFLPEK